MHIKTRRCMEKWFGVSRGKQVKNACSRPVCSLSIDKLSLVCSTQCSAVHCIKSVVR